ncbi:fasciclin domain-containing protein [Thalassococcus sp. S3]|uniref:fasciclin domain-containing protein n=1 Tax=Thalassococcus sp. S3 TaxID=2017482 RepID=UPI0013EE9113|nr:fasciclin domain-containing protein [Thalassococcus sp. S3]
MKTIAEIASGEDFSILLQTVIFIDDQVEGSDLVGALSNPGSLTVFAPNNAAFGQLATDLGFEGDAGDPQAVTDFFVANVPATTQQAIVQYHVLPGAQRAEDIAGAETLETLQGGTITPDLPTLVDNEPDLIDPSLIDTDIEASNGVVHVIDRVLLPTDLPDNDASTFTEIVLESGTGFDANAQDFDILREAVVATNLADALNDPDVDWTVFAPTDAAFVSLANTLGFDGSGEEAALTYLLDALTLLSKGADPSQLLTTILLYHVSGESLQASQVLEGKPIGTLAGEGLTIQADGTSLVDGDPDLQDPNLIATDIQAANGVLHVIDGVLIPVDLLQSDGSNDVDFVIGDDDANTISTGADADLIDAKGGNDRVVAGSGDDIVLGGAGNDLIFGRSGNDHIDGGENNDRIFAGNGDDTVEGSHGRDFIVGGSGDDKLSGGGGKDTILGGSGEDVLLGRQGADALFGNQGDDEIFAGAGNDLVFGGFGDDTIIGGEGNDRIFSNSGDDEAFGGHGADLLLGGFGDDLLDGGASQDTLWGGFGDDTLNGGNGDDVIYSNRGDDEAFGGSGNDTVYGGSGDDTVSGGRGEDVLYGGSGDDTFVFAENWGAERVLDFDLGDDLIDLTSFGFDGFADIKDAIKKDGDDAIIELSGTTITLLNVNANQLEADDFLF